MDVRWLQRYDNMQRAVANLQDAINQGVGSMSDLEKEGTIQRFEVAVELSWKAVRDYLQRQGVQLEPVTPRTTLKEAFAAGVVGDGQLWMDIVAMGNLLRHRYDQATFEDALGQVEAHFLPAMQELRAWLKLRA